MKYIISLFLILLLIGLGHATFMQNFIWKNPKSLWIYAAEKAPDQLRIHHNLGRYYQEHGFKEEAISEYKKALISPGLNRKNEVFITYYNLGKIYNVLKDYEKALYYYNRALYVNPDFPPIYNDIAAVFDGKGDYDIANKYLVKAIRLHPGSIEANFNVGLSYLREGQPEKAIRHFQRVSGEKQFDERVSLYLGIAFKQKDQLGRALTYFNMAIKENPRNIKPYLHLAEVFYRIGDHKQAKRKVAKAINLIPDKDTFQKILKALLTKDRSRNLQPRADIVIPLMREACLSKSEILQEWSDLLREKFFELKRK